VQNKNSLNGFYLDAISSIRVIRTHQATDSLNLVDLILIEADPVKHPVLLTRTRGRPSDPTTLRLAHKTWSAIRTVAGDSGICTWDALEDVTGDSRSKLEALSTVIEMLDPNVLVVDDGYEILPRLDSRETRYLNGGNALVACLELRAATGLGSGFQELFSDFTLSEAHDLISRLDTFLSRIELDSNPETCPFGAELVAASIDRYPLAISTATSTELRTLKDSGLRWDGECWWIVGELDGKTLSDRNLRLSDVTRTE
jgi:hypothetical protein